jgi:cyclopropane fatty-acyl-phospholipid synthase-like methyltransferase
MVEHVGEDMLPQYFAKAFKLLRPGGATRVLARFCI